GAGLKEVPVVVRDTTPREAFALALIETLQREDLNPIEEAQAYERLLEEHGLTQEQMAERVGKDRSTVTNALRLLKLPPPVRQMVERGDLSMGQARALLGLDGAAAIETAARRGGSQQMAVRQGGARGRKAKGRGNGAWQAAARPLWARQRLRQ